MGYLTRFAGLSKCVPAIIVCASFCLASLTAPRPRVHAADPPITSLAFAPDGRSLVTASQAGLSIYSWPELERQRTIQSGMVEVLDLAFSPSGSQLAVAGGTPSESGQVELFSWPDLKTDSLCSDHADSVFSIRWIENTSFATASLDHEVKVWDVPTCKPLLRLAGHSRGVSALCLLKDQRMLISGGLDQNLRVWNLDSGELLRTLNNHTREVQGLAVRPAAEGLPMIASISDDSTVRLWQPTIGRMIRFTRVDAPPLAICWLPNGTQLVVSCTDGHVRWIDPNDARIIKDLPALDGWAYALTVHPTDGSLVVGGRNGQLVRVTASAD